ncbi:hypothetical protein [Klebsiella variicola]|uniref:hypothetical protein n=1 Tax=Klebsiella variicola TaxID=244366 RepID=UPI00345C4DE6
MTNNQLTDEQIAQLLGDACMVIGDRFATVDELSAAKAIRALAVELQERRKPLQDKDLQGVIDALEHPAGINAAGKQVVRLSLVELQERRKADSEPVGWTDEQELRDVEKDGCGYLFKANPITPHADPRRVILLYRHAQQPRVPEEATPDSIEILASARRRDHAVFQWDEDQRNAAADSWNACRAAMLQELKKSAGTEATCRSNENAQVLTSINPAPDLVSLQKKAESIIGNYPGIPDCWCRTCRPVVLNDMRFVVCPDCGNKRCPRANDHRNACTGSNEPGQEGSAYPDAPREVK